MSASTASRILAARVPSSMADSLGPSGAAWTDAIEAEIALAPTPLVAQPTAYIRAAWAGREYGTLPAVRVAAAVAGGDVYIRLRWSAANPRPAISDNNVYADACALLFPLDGIGAELATMGDETQPVQGWHWRGGTSTPFVIRATGIGSVSRESNHGVAVEADWAAGEWAVVFRRALAGPGVPLRGGGSIPVGIAVWLGAMAERAGLKSHTPEWIPMELPQ